MRKKAQKTGCPLWRLFSVQSATSVRIVNYLTPHPHYIHMSINRKCGIRETAATIPFPMRHARMVSPGEVTPFPYRDSG